jgi:hypothetical protein
MASRVRHRIKECGKLCPVLERTDKGWKILKIHPDRESAYEHIENLIYQTWFFEDERLVLWAVEVKSRAGWVCERCHELDTNLLDAHHKKPKYKYPELKYEPQNGQCLCMWCHAVKHRKNKFIRNTILARLGLELALRMGGKTRKHTDSRRYFKDIMNKN